MGGGRGGRVGAAAPRSFVIFDVGEGRGGGGAPIFKGGGGGGGGTNDAPTFGWIGGRGGGGGDLNCTP